MIPKVIHQIWVGPKSMPSEWMQTWKDKNPSLKYELWTEERILDFGLKNKAKYDYYMEHEIYCGIADVARIEILDRLGGIYIDADAVCLEPIENEWFMDKEFFTVVESWDGSRVANGVIGSIPGHPILQYYLHHMERAKRIYHPHNTIGGKMFSNCVDHHGKDDNVVILPLCSFFPKDQRGRSAPVMEGKIYSEHCWGSSKNLYK